MKFPPLTVTSYIRDNGSHADGNAVDFMIRDFSNLDLSKSEKIDLYCSVYYVLAKNIYRSSQFWLAQPGGGCLHYHLDLDPGKPAGLGIEQLDFDPARGGCVHKSVETHSFDNLLVMLREALDDPNWQPLPLELPDPIAAKIERYRGDAKNYKVEIVDLFMIAWPEKMPVYDTILDFLPYQYRKWAAIIALILITLVGGYFTVR